MATQELVNQTEHLESTKKNVVVTQEFEEWSGDDDAEELSKFWRLRKIDGTIAKKAKMLAILRSGLCRKRNKSNKLQSRSKESRG